MQITDEIMEIKSRAVMSGFVSILRGMEKKDIMNEYSFEGYSEEHE